MAQRWFAFSEPGPVAGVRAALLLAALSLFFSPRLARAAELDQGFLLLPAYDLEWIAPPAKVKVGDTLTARLADGGSLALSAKSSGLLAGTPPGVSDDENDSFDVDESVVRAKGAPNSVDEWHVRLTPLKSGHLSVPSLGIADTPGHFIARTNPVGIDVESAIASNDPKAKESEPPEPPVSLAFPLLTLILLGVLGLALLAAAIYWLVRWSRNRKAIPLPAGPPKPEDEVALAALANLERQGALLKGNFKAHYFAISEILKRYVGARYRFDASESTTAEMLALFRAKGSLDALDPLSEMFEQLDRVKFTDYAPSTEEGMGLLEAARKFVLTTRRPPPVADLVTEGQAGASR